MKSVSNEKSKQWKIRDNFLKMDEEKKVYNEAARDKFYCIKVNYKLTLYSPSSLMVGNRKENFPL